MRNEAKRRAATLVGGKHRAEYAKIDGQLTVAIRRSACSVCRLTTIPCLGMCGKQGKWVTRNYTYGLKSPVFVHYKQEDSKVLKSRKIYEGFWSPEIVR